MVHSHSCYQPCFQQQLFKKKADKPSVLPAQQQPADTQVKNLPYLLKSQIFSSGVDTD